VVRTVLAGAGRTTGTHVEMLDLSGLPAAKYILELTTGDRSVRVQLMRL
jgi:hypothetical protein